MKTIHKKLVGGWKNVGRKGNSSSGTKDFREREHFSGALRNTIKKPLIFLGGGTEEES